MKNIISVVFDFDETLASDSTSGFLESIGIDVNNFWKTKVNKLLNDGWDPIPAYLYKMIDESNNGFPINKELLKKYGPHVKYYKGVTRVFSTLKKHIANKKNFQLEFYVISSGIGDILRSTKIAHHFTEIWSSDFAYDSSGKILFPKRIISFTDKTRFLFCISKGLIGEEYKNRPFDVNKKYGKDSFRIPFQQMIFVGDGATDIPCFALMKKMNGTAIAVYDTKNKNKWSKAWEFVEHDRVKNLVPADYSTNSALTTSLKMAISAIIQKIELSQNTY